MSLVYIELGANYGVSISLVFIGGKLELLYLANFSGVVWISCL